MPPKKSNRRVVVFRSEDDSQVDQTVPTPPSTPPPAAEPAPAPAPQFNRFNIDDPYDSDDPVVVTARQAYINSPDSDTESGPSAPKRKREDVEQEEREVGQDDPEAITVEDSQDETLVKKTTSLSQKAKPTLQEEEDAKWYTHPKTHKRYLIHSPDTPKEIADDINRGIGKVMVTNHGILRRMSYLHAWNTYTFGMVNPNNGPHIHSGDSSLIEAYAQWKIKVSKDALRTYEQKEEQRKVEEHKQQRKKYMEESRDRWMASNGHACVCSFNTCTCKCHEYPTY
ncbi:uncharacterized protein LOC116299430 [Actinia tenebrosa]|uniref:Uncharacterized protein LOC116299430 n=1 Tax=Actinia tenebrosa TaxID=6105 RepID=A0A6P8IE23_ACTTE|nr:uncharacterized protein LOC116299430 [Actinia tenebrosa]